MEKDKEWETEKRLIGYLDCNRTLAMGTNIDGRHLD